MVLFLFTSLDTERSASLLIQEAVSSVFQLSVFGPCLQLMTLFPTPVTKPFTIPFGVMSFVRSALQLLPSNTEQMTMIGRVCSWSVIATPPSQLSPMQFRSRANWASELGGHWHTAPLWVTGWFNSFLMPGTRYRWLIEMQPNKPGRKVHRDNCCWALACHSLMYLKDLEWLRNCKAV